MEDTAPRRLSNSMLGTISRTPKAILDTSKLRQDTATNNHHNNLSSIMAINSRHPRHTPMLFRNNNMLLDL